MSLGSWDFFFGFVFFIEKNFKRISLSHPLKAEEKCVGDLERLSEGISFLFMLQFSLLL